MDHLELAAMCRALGDPTRAHIVRFLIGCCCPVAVEEDGAVRPSDGATVGDVCCHVTGSDEISSNVSFHLGELRKAGLVKTERRGKYIAYSIDRGAMAKLAEFFSQTDCGECCK